MAAVQQLSSPPGVALTTAMQTIRQNPANSGFREIVQITINNIDGVNDAAVPNCNFVDAAPAGTFAVLPVNVKVAKLDNLTFTKTLDPGDLIQGNASANGDLVAIVEIIGREAV